MRTERAAHTTRAKDGTILVKAAIGSPRIVDSAYQIVWGQIVVRGKPLVGSAMSATWRFDGGLRRCSVRTDPWGIASCSEKALAFSAVDGNTIPVNVSFSYGHHVYTSRVTYVPLSD